MRISSTIITYHRISAFLGNQEQVLGSKGVHGPRNQRRISESAKRVSFSVIE
jgi:hypothetical protein